MDLFANRIATVRRALAGWQVDGLLVTSRVNITWLSGFTGTAGTLLVTNETAILATDARYWQQAAVQAPGFQLYKHKRQLQDTADLLASAGVRTAGIEANHVTLQQAQEFETIEGIAWRFLNTPVEPLRRCKALEEITAIRESAAIADAAMSLLPDLIRQGISERELAWRLEQKMREDGANGMAFPPIIAFGENSARPHYTPGDRTLQPGDIVLVDIGAIRNGYNSDLTRTFLYSASPDARFQEIFETVLAAQQTAVAAATPGANTREVHMLAADFIASAGYGDAFNHGLGHGLGLEVHEEPYFSAVRPSQILEQGMVITIEPGIYLPGWGGIRIEDLILVTEGEPEYLSRSPKPRLLPII